MKLDRDTQYREEHDQICILEWSLWKQYVQLSRAGFKAGRLVMSVKIIKAWTRAMAVEIEGVAILGLRCGLEKHWFWVRGGSHLRRLRILTEVPGLWMTSLAKNWSKLRSGDEFSLGHTAFVRPVGHSRGWEQNTVE